MRRLLFCLLSTCVLPLTASAHVLDQYLQVAQIAITPTNIRIELRLIPGVQVAARICALIDTNSDGQITTAEEQIYANRVLRDLSLTINGVNTPLILGNIEFPTKQEMQEGIGTIRLALISTTMVGDAGSQQIYFRNNHLPELSGYLVNALVPSTKDIQISGQERDPLQREIKLRFHRNSSEAGKLQFWGGRLIFGLCLMLLLTQWKQLRHYLRRENKESRVKNVLN